MTSKNISKYLSNYAEVEISALATFPKAISFNHVVVIPAYKENADFIHRFNHSNLAQSHALVICVINQPETEENKEQQQNLYNEAIKLGEVVWHVDKMSLVSLNNSNSNLLLVNRFKTPIPIKEGVGLARKIGADIALSLINKRIVKSRWIYSTDADAHLPSDYFSVLNDVNVNMNNTEDGKKTSDKMCVAYCFNFSHQSTNEVIHQANKLYETALRYYVAGLAYAKSEYAFYTIGSILVFDAHAYASVRGFPKKSAGEDFYLLNKIAKLGKVKFIVNSTILLDARESDRVPFGTGPAVSHIMALEKQNNEYCYYHPKSFEALKTLLSAYKSLWEYKGNIDDWYTQLPVYITEVLLTIGLSNFVEKQQNASQAQFNKQLSTWFDAFKTLKFIHGMRVTAYNDIPLKEIVKDCCFY